MIGQQYPTQQYGTISSTPQDLAFARSFGQKVPKVEGYEAPKKAVDVPQILTSLFVPWLIFVFTFALMSTRFHYDFASATLCLCFALLAASLYLGYLYIAAVQDGNPNFWLGFAFATSLLWWTIAFMGGNVNFLSNFEPVYDVTRLNVYPMVDPAVYRGNGLMDAGVIQFTADSRVHLPLSMNFKNKDMYCAAPIISGPANASLNYSLDFWAIGKNCCNGDIASFRCGEYNNPKARSGLRLMNDNDRLFFRLVVEQAEASFHVTATHPIFLYWMQDPMDEIKAYQDDGMRVMKLSVCSALVGQVVLTFIAYQIFMRTCLK